MPLLSFIFLTFAPESGIFRFLFYVKTKETIDEWT